MIIVPTESVYLTKIAAIVSRAANPITIFLEKFTFPVYYDYNSVFAEGIRIKFVPTNIFIDKNGKITSVAAETISDENDFANRLK